MLQGMLKTEGHAVGRLHVATLMRKMGIEALYRRPRTTKPAPGHKVYPYLLRNLAVTHPNHVWAMDITDVPMARARHCRSDHVWTAPAGQGRCSVRHLVGRGHVYGV